MRTILPQKGTTLRTIGIATCTVGVHSIPLTQSAAGGNDPPPPEAKKLIIVGRNPLKTVTTATMSNKQGQYTGQRVW